MKETIAIIASVSLALVFALLVSTPAHADGPPTIRYVAVSGSDTSDCTNAAFPCATVQHAVDQADAGDEVRLAQGRHTGVNGRGGLSQVVYVSQTVTIRGGYTTTNWTTPDSDAYPTILDAQGQGRVLYVAGEISPTIEGLRITGGDAAGLGGDPVYDSYDAGGGVALIGTNATLSNTVIFSNTVSDGWAFGGGLLVDGGRNTIAHTVICSNTIQANGSSTYVYARGGGVYVAGPANVLEGNEIYANLAGAGVSGYGTGAYAYGGGVYADGASLIDNAIHDNLARAVNPDATYARAYGGGVCVTGDATLADNDVRANTALVSDSNNTGRARGEAFGGGLFVDFGADGTTIDRNTVLSNTTAAFAACVGSYPYPINCTEEAYARGGGVYVYRADGVTLTHTVVAANGVTATVEGNADDGSYPQMRGGGIYVDASDAQLDANVIAANEARRGGGLYLYQTGVSWPGLTNNVVVDNADDGMYVTGSGAPTFRHTSIARNGGTGVVVTGGSATLTNTIVASHTTGVTVTAGGTARLGHTLWHDNGLDAGGPGTLWRSHDHAGDPAFAPDGYHLTVQSAAIDRGVNSGISADVDGDPRDGAPDLGADELIFTCHARAGGTTYHTVQDAVDAVPAGGVVKIAGYCPSASAAPVASIRETLTLRGGYTTTNWTTPDVEAHPTTLDAKGNGRVLYAAGDISPTIAGLRITGGHLDAPGNGAGVYANVRHVIITRCAIISNTIAWADDPYATGRGAGAYVTGGRATLAGNTVSHNVISATIPAGTGTVQEHGAGLYLASATRMSQNEVSHNHLYGYDYGGLSLGNFYGAGIHATGALTMSGDVVAGNTISATGGSPGDAYVSVYARGGGLYAQGALHLSGAIVAHNVIKTPHYLTAAYLQGAGIYVQNDDHVDVANAIIADNRIDSNRSGGAGLYAQYDGDLRVRHTTVARNAGGTGARVPGGLLTNTVVVSHTTGVDGGSSATLDGVLWYDNDANTAGTVTVTHAYTGTPAFAPDGYHVTDSSAAIDRGVDAGVARDVDGESRDGTPDLGADEYVPPPPLTITKTASTAIVGANLVYVLTVENVGTESLDVTVTDEVPDGGHYVAGSGGSESGGLVTWDTLTVGAGDAEAVSFAVTTCQTTITNATYRVETADGIERVSGVPVVSTLGEESISAGIDHAESGRNAAFSATVSTDGGPIARYHWDLGDGATAWGETAAHGYALPGAYTVTLTVTDTCGYADRATTTVHLTNAAPVAVRDVMQVDEDTWGVVNVLDNDTDADADDLSVIAVGEPLSGTASLAMGHTVIYTPDTDFNGSDSFGYVASDGVLTASAVVSVTIAAVNDPVVARDDAFSTDEDVAVTTRPLDNDTDADGDDLHVAHVTAPARGSAIVNADGTVSYIPDADFNGSDSFGYVVSDGTVTDTAVVSMTVAAVDDPPVAVDDLATTYHDTPVTIDVLANDGDPDGDSLAIASLSDPPHGSTTVTDQDDVAYAPESGFSGADAFTYVVTDGALTDTATVSVTVSPASLSDLVVHGPITSVVNVPHVFTAGVEPSAGTGAVTYTWSPPPLDGQSTPTATYRWTDPGVYTLTLWAEDVGSVVSDTHTVTIAVAPPTVIYLPLVARNFSTGPATHVLEDAPDACAGGYPVQMVDAYRDDFDHENDNDWYTFEGTAGQPYRMWTFDLASESDTSIALYAADCETKLAENDDVDWPDDVSSRIEWTAPEDGAYCVQVRHYDWRIYGEHTAYTFSVLPTPPRALHGGVEEVEASGDGSSPPPKSVPRPTPYPGSGRLTPGKASRKRQKPTPPATPDKPPPPATPVPLATVTPSPTSRSEGASSPSASKAEDRERETPSPLLPQTGAAASRATKAPTARYEAIACLGAGADENWENVAKAFLPFAVIILFSLACLAYSVIRRKRGRLV